MIMPQEADKDSKTVCAKFTHCFFFLLHFFLCLSFELCQHVSHRFLKTFPENIGFYFLLIKKAECFIHKWYFSTSTIDIHTL